MMVYMLREYRKHLKPTPLDGRIFVMLGDEKDTAKGKRLEGEGSGSKGKGSTRKG